MIKGKWSIMETRGGDAYLISWDGPQGLMYRLMVEYGLVAVTPGDCLWKRLRHFCREARLCLRNSIEEKTRTEFMRTLVSQPIYAVDCGRGSDETVLAICRALTESNPWAPITVQKCPKTAGLLAELDAHAEFLRGLE